MVKELLRRYNPWWEDVYLPPGVIRERHLDNLKDLVDKRRMVLVYGIRRCGKSTLLKQFASIEGQDIGHDHILYVSLDHPTFREMEISKIIDTFRSIHRISRKEKCYVLLDEIQVIPEFESELKALYDLEENLFFICSGSNSLLIKHRSGALTGRHGRIHLKPLDFMEFMKFMDYNPKPSESFLLYEYLEEYLDVGGIPQYVLTRDPQYIEDLVEDIIYKDIVPRYGVRDPKVLLDLFSLLCQRAGQRITPIKLSKVLKISHDSISRYISYFQDTFLVDLIDKDGTPNESRYSPKKIYIHDQGILTIFGSSIPMGSKVENLVYNELKKEYRAVNYIIAKGKEIDFVVKDKIVEVKFKDHIDEKDMDSIMNLDLQKTKKKLVVSRSKQNIEGIDSISLLALVLPEYEDMS